MLREFNKIHVAETFEEDVYRVLRQMVERGETSAPLYEGGELTHLRVVIGGEYPDAMTAFDVPPDLKGRVTGRIYVVPV